MSRSQGYWSVVAIRDNPFESKEQLFSWFLQTAQSNNPLEIETDQPKIGTWVFKCRFAFFEQASNLCDFWQSNKGNSASAIYVGAWNNNQFLDMWSNPEKRMQTTLHQKLGGKKEVVTPLGKIDLLTDTEIIEIKLFKNWKSALGQLLVYSKFYPNHQKRLYLFDRQVPKKLDMIKQACISYGIIVDFEVDQGWRHD